MGVVIGETAEVGENVTLLHGVTLGGTSLKKEKRHPTLGDNVVVGAGAGVFGAFTIGSGSRIGAGSVVVREVPPNSVVVGVPGRVTSRHGQRVGGDIDLNQVDLPDPLARTLEQLRGPHPLARGGGRAAQEGHPTRPASPIVNEMSPRIVDDRSRRRHGRC